MLRSDAKHRVSKQGPRCATEGHRLGVWGRLAAPRNEVFKIELEASKKLRKNAAKTMKSLARVNLCAGSRARSRP
jgi:hypothetical protein